MFGNRVTEKDKFTDGTYGYTIAVDLTPLNASRTVSVIASDDGTDSDPVTAPSELQILLAYINASDCPDLAYHLGSDILTIFFKSAVYPYSDTTKYLIAGYRSALPVSTLEDFPDIKNKHVELFTLLAIEKAGIVLNKNVPQKITQRISELKSLLKEVI